MSAYFDKKNQFLELYDSKDDLYIRKTSIIDDEESFMRSFPAFLTISIVGGCKVRDSCYLDCCAGKREYSDSSNMSYEAFKRIIDEGAEKGLLSIVLTGSGDPNDHPSFKKFVLYAKSKGLHVTCITTGSSIESKDIKFYKKNIDRIEFNLLFENKKSLDTLTSLLKEKANLTLRLLVSYLSIDSIICFLNSGALEFDNEERIIRLRGKGAIGKLKAVSLHLYKRKGLGTLSGCVSKEQHEYIKTLIRTLKKKTFPSVSLEPCFESLLREYIKKDPKIYIPPCEQGRYSAYISEDLTMLPCEFANAEKYGKSLHTKTIEEVFNDKKFAEYREKYSNCTSCTLLGGHKNAN